MKSRWEIHLRVAVDSNKKHFFLNEPIEGRNKGICGYDFNIINGGQATLKQLDQYIIFLI